MKNKMVKILYATACVMAGTAAGAGSILPAFAAEASEAAAPAAAAVTATVNTRNGRADFGRGKASISITGNVGQTLAGKKFNVYKLFDAENSKGLESINYTIHAPYEKALKTVVGKKLSKSAGNVTEYEVIDYMQSLKQSTQDGTKEGSYSAYRYFLEELRNEIVAEGVVGDQVNVVDTGADNKVIIGGLEYGYYIVDEVTVVDGTHAAASMCIVNTAAPDAYVNIKSDYPSVEKKIQEDDNRNEIGKNGWNDIADYEIGQNVPFKYESVVPNMNGYDKYYFAWHDIIDPALTFKLNSVKIVIQEAEGLGTKEYQLQNNEYRIYMDPGNNESFKIQIDNLKAIVDREFNHMNELKENIYGQKVILTYDAVLNEKAAQDTGRPGFENSVRLEFSNNADHDGSGDKGTTPWDTVVCFTYKIDGLKINNENTKLEGAKFRLYSDEACTEEVYVKKVTDGYQVVNRDSLGGSDHTGGTAPTDAVEMISNKEGAFKIYGLDGGRYYLKETKAPDGYRPLLDPIVIDVTPEYTNDREHYVKGDGATDKTLKKLTATAHVKEFLNGAYQNRDVDLTTDADTGNINLSVVNTIGKKLPLTGSYATLILLGAGTVMVSYGLSRKKKK